MRRVYLLRHSATVDGRALASGHAYDLPADEATRLVDAGHAQDWPGDATAVLAPVPTSAPSSAPSSPAGD